MATRLPLNLSARPGSRLAMGGEPAGSDGLSMLGGAIGASAVPAAPVTTPTRPTPPPGAPAGAAPAGTPPPPPAGGTPASPVSAATLIGAVRPAIDLGVLQPLIPDLRALMPKTTTQLARSALNQLSAASREHLDEALKTLQGKGIAAGQIIGYLERRVRIGEVLNELSDRWSAETVDDFAAAFQMDRSRTAIMDLIVAIAVLNDPQLENELLAENQPRTADGDLMQRRQVVWQHPPAGTPLEPPYIVLLAVDYRDVAGAQQVVASIIGQLVEARGYRIPRDAAARLG